MTDDKKPQDYETAKTALKNIWQHDYGSTMESSRRLYKRKIIWDSASNTVLMVETVRALEKHGFGNREYEYYNYETQVTFDSLPKDIKTKLKISDGSSRLEVEDNLVS
ncbi:hypothetical protein [Nostoc sp. WHI]|jgi:hypothetical protein|uniref:hypothetical protein n=1 Tax=Nostoc sp. WHI TaxID=2650611 RepID=UPI0018C4FEB4|nr:hypothetical protein [Nostoc sp. WHI]MBG1266960.1 hypothetical protein [Nostoc sp. WHI]